MISDSPVAVKAIGLSKIYGSGEGEVQALADLDLEFKTGEFTAIMGPSGSGKSTLMHLLAGLDAPSTGSSFIFDVEVSSLSDDELAELRRTRVGFVFQSFNLLPILNVEQNILLPLNIAGKKITAKNRERFAELVEILGLEARLNHLPSQLSGGQKQRVAIARALIAEPQVIFADEPTGNLDTRSGVGVLDFLRRSVRELNSTIIMVTHDPAAAAYADRVVLIADGHLAGEVSNPSPQSVLAALDGLRDFETTAAITNLGH